MSKKQLQSRPEVTDEVIRAYAEVVRLVANKGRLKVLVILSHGPRTWTQLMFESKSNPKSLSDYLQLLVEKGLVEKKSDKYYVTDAGRALVSMSLDKMIEMADLATKAAITQIESSE